jgi:FkbM family methyltransferase
MTTIFKPHEAINHIKPYLSDTPIIIEAGAFNGGDTQKLAAAWPRGTIHAFEPVPEIFQKLQKNTAYLSNVHCYPLALGPTDGTATFYMAEKKEKPGIPTQAGSLLQPKERLAISPILFPHTIQVPTITLTTWAQTYGVTKIDFMWLDMQGCELDVLKASPSILEQTTALYMEVGFIEAYEGQKKYAEIVEWLAIYNFKEVGRDFENQTDWFFGNVLFVKNK